MPAVTLEQFINAIAGQESGGNPYAVNSRSGALGRYQIMPFNVGPWSQRYLGYTVTPQQFLSNPALQDQLARAVLTSYFNQYGARGAAAAWYAGPGGVSSANNYTRFRSNEPSIGEYVDQVLARAGSAPGGAQVSYTAGKVPDIPDWMTQSPEAPTPFGGLEAASGGVGLGASSESAVGLGASSESAVGLGAATGGVGLSSGAQDSSSGQPKLDPLPGLKAPADAFAEADRQLAEARTNVTGLRRGVLDHATQNVGAPYVWGGTSPAGFDCSGLMQYVFGQMGIELPRTSWAQLAQGTQTSIASLLPGDLVGFGSGAHVALYLGNGQILEAPNSVAPVRIRNLSAGEDAWGVSLANLYH